MVAAACVAFNSFDGIKKKWFELLFFGTMRKWNRIRKTKFMNRTRIKLSEFFNILNHFRPDISFLLKFACQSFRPLRDKKKRERGRRSEEAPVR